jgi:hypothetical protein
MSRTSSPARAPAKRKPVTSKAQAANAAARPSKPTAKRVSAPSRTEKRSGTSRTRSRTAAEGAAPRTKKKAAARTAHPAPTRPGASAAKSTAKTAAKATRTRRKALNPPTVRTTDPAPAARTPQEPTPASRPAMAVSPQPTKEPALRRAVSRRAILERGGDRHPLPEPPARRPRFRLGTFDDLIAPFPSQVQTLCLALRGLISRVVPGARETIITGLQLALFEQDGPIGLLSPQRDHARLYFVRGSELKDQSRLLQGGSGALPFVKLWHLDTLQVPALRNLLQEAVELNREKPVPNLTARLFGDLSL